MKKLFLFLILLLCTDALQALTITADFTSASTIPVAAASYTATGNDVDLSLGFAPPTGTDLTVIKNTGLGFISGQFNNLKQGQKVALAFNGLTYLFVANYHGGSGNDLVLQWAYRSAYGWGRNDYGQLGNNNTTESDVPVTVTASGVLAGKCVVAAAAGGSHNLALCSDGTVAAWGRNSEGQLGNNSMTSSSVPVAVTTSGVLAGKTVIAVAAGGSHSLALCSDGTLAAWGYNYYGQLGNNSTTNSSVPVAVTSTGVLGGKTVVAVAAGSAHSLVLCSDGTVAAWGRNSEGQLGNNSTTDSLVPVTVTANGVLAGRTVVAVASGSYHSLALCSDGAVAAWGYNNDGELGNNSTTYSSGVPVAVTTTGVLAGKTVVAMAAGEVHSIALCSDGTLAAWGKNSDGQLGNNSTTNSRVPVAVTATGVLAGKTVVAVASRGSHSFALCSDGAVAAWGSNPYGQLGNSSTTDSKVPVAVTATGVLAGKTVVAVAAGFSCGFAIVAGPPDSTLSSLSLDSFSLSPGFTSKIFAYSASVPNSTPSVSLTPIVTDEYAMVRVNGISVASGSASQPIPLSVGSNAIMIVVTALDGTASTYTVNVLRTSDVDFTYVTADQAAMTAPVYAATGNDVNLSLGFAPPTGTELMVIRNTGLGFINGQFNNLKQGQKVALAFNGIIYEFVANYFGGSGNDLVLQWADRRAYGWGANAFGLLGNSSTADSRVPVAVTSTGVLVGKTVVAVATGDYHSLALCSDGTLAAWGYNSYGQLGNNSTTDSHEPLTVTADGVLAGKTVVAVAAGSSHSLALCSDGTLASWGDNSEGQLGNNSTANSSVPVAVTAMGVLAGKTVVAVAAGGAHSLALCSDGTLAAWGWNSSGQLGNNSTTDSSVPVAVTNTGILVGKAVVAVVAGWSHSLALCSDGTLAAWGSNYSGQLGNNSTTNSSVPVEVTSTGILVGKTVVEVAAGGSHSLALCSDGSLAAWGSNYYGQLGNNSTTNSSVPVAVTATGNLVGKTVVAVTAGSSHSLASCSNGTVAAWGHNSEGQLGNNSTTDSLVPVTVTADGVLAGKAVGAVAAGGNHSLVVAGDPLSADSTLSSLILESSTLYPNSSPSGFTYSSSVSNATTSATITPTVTHAYATVKVNGLAVASGGASQSIPLAIGNTLIAIVVTAQDGSTSTYTVNVLRTSDVKFTFAAADQAAVTASAYAATGNDVSLSLGFAPPAGTDLTVIRNTGLGFINGQFNNLKQGQRVALAFNKGIYEFVANYYGGSGNDLVLQWADRRAYGWGKDSSGQLGNNNTTNSSVPVAVITTGILFGKTVVAVAAGGSHSLALCSDGTLAAWGDNGYGQLGNNSTIDSKVPVAVTADGVLAGKTVVAVAVGDSHSLVLCSDGTLAAWGSNYEGQLGNNSTTSRRVPVTVTATGALAGKTVVSVAAGDSHSLALCSDGTVAAWGDNSDGQLGNDGMGYSSKVPVAVTATGVLAGKTVVAVEAGSSHSLALCSDGTVAAWGRNGSGQLGNNSTTDSSVPVAVIAVGVLAGKTVVAMGAGGSHSLALCADGTLAAWGSNYYGQLGDDGMGYSSSVPVAVTTSGVLAGKTVIAVAAGDTHSLASCSDGTLAVWGDNECGQLGNNSIAYSSVPVAVASTGVLDGKTVVSVAARYCFNLVIAAGPFPPDPTLSSLTLDASSLNPAFSPSVVKYSASVSNATTSVKVTPTVTHAYAMVKVNGSPVVSGAASSAIPVAVGVTTITIVVTAQDGTTTRTYTIKVTRAKSSVATLSGLVVKSATLSPKFKPATLNYTASVSKSTTSVKIKPTASHARATIKVNGKAVKSGALSAAIPLASGKNTIKVVVTAEDGTTKTYKIVITRSVAVGSPPKFSLAHSTVPLETHTFKAMVDGKRYQRLTVVKPDHACAVVIEVSPDLVHWFSGDRHTTTVRDDDRVLAVRDNTPVTPGVKRFIRVRPHVPWDPENLHPSEISNILR